MPPRPPLLTRNFAVVCAATLAFFTANNMQIPVFPDFMRERVGAGGAGIGLFIGLFSVTAVLLRPTVGRALEHRARSTFMILAGAITAVAALGYQAAGDWWVLVPIRLLHGVAIAFYYTAASTLVADIAPEERRAEALSYFSMFLYLGLAIGPAIGIALEHGGGFAPVFLASAGIGLACAVFARSVTEPPLGEHAPDAGRGPLVSREALFPAAVLGLAAVAYGAAVNFSADMASQKGLGGQWYFPALAVAVIVTRAFSGRAADRYGRVLVAAPGLGLFAVAMVVESRSGSTAALLASAVAFGVGFGSFFPSMMALTIDRVSPQRRGLALGTFTAAFDVGFGAGSPLMGAIAGSAGYDAMYLVAALFALGALALLVTGSARARRAVASAPGLS